MAEQIKSLKTGIKYKDTPIGRIPVDWEIKNLIDTAKDEPYSFTGGPFGSNLKESSYTDSGVRIIQLQNIGDGEFLNEYQIFTSEEKADQLKSCNIYPGDIIIAKMADPVARACLIPNSDKRYLMASDGIRLSVSEKLYDKIFILYSINSKYFRENAERHSSGTTRLRIGLTELKNLPLAIPPLVEQKKIAEILSTVDKAIEKADQVIEKTKEAKKGLMQRLLTRGIGHKKFKKTIIGKIPVDWEVVRLGERCDVIGGSTPSTTRKEFWNGDIPFATPTDITNLCGREISNTKQKITQEGLASCGTRLLPAGSVLLTSRATIGACAINTCPMATNQGFASLVCGKKTFNWFIFYMMTFIQNDLQRIGSGSTFKEVSKHSLRQLNVTLPPLAEQKKIANILTTIDDDIRKYSGHKSNLELLKNGLMQVLLTGRIRVKA